MERRRQRERSGREREENREINKESNRKREEIEWGEGRERESWAVREWDSTLLDEPANIFKRKNNENINENLKMKEKIEWEIFSQRIISNYLF